jgi:hypothetical protein
VSRWLQTESPVENQLAGAVIICKVCRLAIALLLIVIPSGAYKWSINPFTNPHPVYSHTRDNIFMFRLTRYKRTARYDPGYVSLKATVQPANSKQHGISVVLKF